MVKYQLVEKKPKEVDVFKVFIEGDSNDGDYISNTEQYSKKEFEEYVLDGLIELQEKYSGPHQLENYPNDHDLSIPYNGFDGYCHTLTELTVEYIDADGKVWDVVFETS